MATVASSTDRSATLPVKMDPTPEKKAIPPNPLDRLAATLL